MNLVFDDNGDFKPGTIVSEAGGTLQVATHSGKRIKVKSSHVMLQFRTPEPAQMLQEAQQLSSQIDLDLVWECAPQDEFGFEDLAQTYFGDKATETERFATLLAVHGSPIYFYRKGRGRYRPATPETLKAALAAVERRKQQQLQIDEWAAALAQGRCPDAVRQQAASLLVAPDKNGPQFKAMQQACDLTGQSPTQLLMKVGAFKSAFDLHYKQFIQSSFPKGIGFKSVVSPSMPSDLKLSSARCFSIDDSSTTEIDDCLSVQWLEDNRIKVGVHIAAPAVAIRYGDELDLVAQDRMSTLYMPGDKITMLPDPVVASLSLDEGRKVPAVSIYVVFDIAAGQMLAETLDTQLELIHVAANLRHDRLDHLVTESLLDDTNAAEDSIEVPFARELSALWSVTKILGAERDRIRGKPEARNRADFNFRVDHEAGRVEITERQRGAPLDRIVAEMMIFANNQWGKFLAAHLTPAIYRSQQMGRVRMTIYPQPHQGLGVTHYGWFTSPLRRYSDLVNQRQLLAILESEAAPFGQNDARLHAVIAAFDARYASYNDFQSKMEKYWCLRWLQQFDTQRFEAVVVKPQLIRLTRAPLYIPMSSLPEIAAGRTVLVDILAMDEVELTVEARFVELVQQAAAVEVEEIEEIGDPVVATADPSVVAPPPSP